MLPIENLHATVADKEILKGISLTLNAGEITRSWGRKGRASRPAPKKEQADGDAL